MKEIKTIFRSVKDASKEIPFYAEKQINDTLLDLAEEVRKRSQFILIENKKDLEKMDSSNPKYDRLKLTESRIDDIAKGIENVASLPSPLDRVISSTVRPNGMKLKRVTVPFGVIGMIYEARPNVTLDVFSLCFKSGNACILKGGSDADNSNRALVEIIHNVLKKHNININIVALLPIGHESTAQLLEARGFVDLLIPRGGRGLIDFVRENARIPVIETGAGVCHVFFDKTGDIDKGAAIISNSKTRRVSVCNALDCLLIDKNRIDDLGKLCDKMSKSNVVIYADDISYHILSESYPAELLKHSDETTYGTEFLDYKMAVKCVDGIDEAVKHISRFGSGHSECIVTEDSKNASFFQKAVDAVCVYVNVATAFTDGGEFGLGAEIGISTQKLHARGPMGLEELNTYKWLIEGDGQIR